MTTLPIAAGIGAEGIIWVIILIFWGIAQIVQKSRRPPQRPPNQPPRPVSPMENELRELLEQLSGQPPSRPVVQVDEELPEELEEEVEEPEPPPVQRRPPPPPPLRPQRPTPAITAAHSRRPTPLPVSRELEPALLPELTPALRAEIADETPFLKSASVSQVVSMRGMAMHVPVGQTRRGRPAFNPQSLRDPQNLRQIVMARLVLDPPKALERPGNSLTGT